jgi:ribosomal protein S18 acetylase RimI-like enzyme
MTRVIRKRIPERDDRTILQLIRSELLPYTKRTLPDVTLDPSTLAERLDGDTTYVLVRNGTQPIGFVSCLIRGKTLNIDMIAVDKRAQGKGLGSRLMSTAERFGIRRGCDNVVLYVDQANRGAQRFYEKKGYVIHSYVAKYECYEMTKHF